MEILKTVKAIGSSQIRKQVKLKNRIRQFMANITLKTALIYEKEGVVKLGI